MAIRYKVTTYGGVRGLQFPDLLVKYSSGYTIPLEVPEGEYVPLEILDPLDVKKSLIVGSLGKFIASGKVTVVNDELSKIDLSKPKQEVKKEEPKKVEEKKEPTINKFQIIQKEPTKQEDTSSSDPIDPKVEPPKVIEPQLTSLSDVKELKDFDRLSFYLKKRFLRETKDRALLLRIYQTTDSNSFKLQVKQRLKDFG